MSLRIKICGLTNLADARCAADCGADLLGFIQYPPSPRYVSPETVAAIIRELPISIETVGVFVNETADTIKAIAETAGFTTIQLHGDEPHSILKELGAYNVIKAVGIKTDADRYKLNNWQTVPLLIDTPCPEHGGSGQVGNWELAASIAATQPTYLAGGLTPDNVAEAVHQVRPFGVDIASGVEASKGIKDHSLIRAFIANARLAEGG